MAAGEGAIAGQAPGMSNVTVDGEPALRMGHEWLTPRTLEPGIHVVDVAAVDPEGQAHTRRYGFLAGDFAEPGPVAGALQVRVGADGLAGVGPLIEELLDPAALLANVGGGAPLYDDGDIAVYLAGVDVPAMTVEAVPMDGFVDLTLWMPGLAVPLDVETQLWFIDIDLDAEVRMDQAAISGALILEDDGMGGADVALRDVQVMVSGVELDIDGLADFIEDLFLDDQQVENLLADNLDPLAAAIPQLVADVLQDLDLDLEVELDLLGTPIHVKPQLAGLAVHPAGIDMGMDVAVTVPGSPRGPGALTVGTPDWPAGTGVQAALADDMVNTALYTLWEGGALDLDLPIEAGGLQATLLTLFGGDPAAGGAIAVSAGLPPVLVERDGQARLQLAEWGLTVQTPGGAHGDEVQVMLAVDAAFDLTLDSEAVGARLSDATVKLAPMEGTPDALVAELPALEQGLGAGIALANSMLTFPLADLGLEMSLPPIDLGRSADGRATAVEVDLAGWTPGA